MAIDPAKDQIPNGTAKPSHEFESAIEPSATLATPNAGTMTVLRPKRSASQPPRGVPTRLVPIRNVPEPSHAKLCHETPLLGRSLLALPTYVVKRT